MSVADKTSKCFVFIDLNRNFIARCHNVVSLMDCLVFQSPLLHETNFLNCHFLYSPGGPIIDSCISGCFCNQDLILGDAADGME